MKKDIINLFFSRVFIALLNFALLLLSSRLLGAEARGIINIFLVQIGIILLLAELFSGPVVVYLYHRINTQQLYFYSRLFGSITVIILYLFAELSVGIISEGFIVMPIIGLLHVLLNNKQMFLLASKKNKWHNILITTQPLLFLSIFLILFFIIQNNDVFTYFIAWISSLTITNILGLKFNPDENNLPKRKLKFIITLLFRRSKWIIVSNILHLLAARIIYFYIENTSGIKTVGIFGTSVSLAESLLLLSVSVSSIVYANASHQGKKNISDTFKYAGISFYLSFVGLIILALIPNSLWRILLGDDFNQIQSQIIILGPVILIAGLSTILSNFLSGNGKFKISAVGSGLALSINLILGWFWVKKLGIYGAIVSMFLANFIQFIWLVWFMKSKILLLPMKKTLRLIFNPLNHISKN